MEANFIDELNDSVSKNQPLTGVVCLYGGTGPKLDEPGYSIEAEVTTANDESYGCYMLTDFKIAETVLTCVLSIDEHPPVLLTLNATASNTVFTFSATYVPKLKGIPTHTGIAFEVTENDLNNLIADSSKVCFARLVHNVTGNEEKICINEVVESEGEYTCSIEDQPHRQLDLQFLDGNAVFELHDIPAGVPAVAWIFDAKS